MKKYLPFILLLLLMISFHQAIADDQDKTDGSFVGGNPQEPINSSFVGDDSRSVDNNSFVGEDVKKQTDTDFVGENTITEQNSEFQGNDFDQQVKEGKDAPFAGDRTFIGNDYGQ